MADVRELSNFIWQIADLLRGPYRQSEYGRVMLPMTVLRRFDCVLAPTKELVLGLAKWQDTFQDKQSELEPILNKVTGQSFHNCSPLNFENLKGDRQNIDKHLVSYIEGFSKNVREIFERFEFAKEIEKMREANILYLVFTQFCNVDLHPSKVDNILMGSLFEDLICRFYEVANETAGNGFTPREVVRLMVDILFNPDGESLTKPGIIRRLLDPVCGTGGMLSEAQNYLREHNSQAKLWVCGQDINPYTYAIAASKLLIRGNENSSICFGDSLIDDRYPNAHFEYLLAHPPFSIDWKKQQQQVKSEHKTQGFAGRFGAGLPRIGDSSLLFLQHMISKFEPYQPEEDKNGSRLALVFNGSPLFTGGAGSGESEIRKWVIENDWLETIIALPEQMFDNTGINTYVLIVTNCKQKHRRGKIQLIDARSRWQPIRHNSGNKHRYMSEEDIAVVVREYGQFVESETSKIFKNEDFGYNRVPIERPLRLLYQMSVERKSRFLDAVPHLLKDVQAIDRELGRSPRPDWSEFDKQMKNLLKERGSKWKKTEHKLFRYVFTDRNPDAERVILKERQATDELNARVWGWFGDTKGKVERMYEIDTQLRDFENVHLVDKDNKDANEKAIVDYFYSEVEPYVSDAWADKEKIRSGYEINFNRYFYNYKPPRPLVEIDADLKRMEEEIIRLLREVTA